MKQLASYTAALILVTGLFTANTLSASDLTPPTWTRGGPQTTYQEWINPGSVDFDPIFADISSHGAGSYNLSGGPAAILVSGLLFDSGDSFNSYYIPNFTNGSIQTLLHIQITGSGTYVSSVDGGQLVFDSSGGAAVPYHYEDWLINGNVTSEMVTIATSGVNLGPTGINIDTLAVMAVPEPATMLILGSSLLVGMCAKRKKATHKKVKIS